MGVTSLPKFVFLEFIENLKDVYHADSYHLLDSNCNNFTSDVVQFLTNKDIPEFIKNLPKEFMRTPLGQMLRPMIEGMFGPSRLAGLPTPLPSEPPSGSIGVKCPSPLGDLPLRSLRSIGTASVVLCSTTVQDAKTMFKMLRGLLAEAEDRKCDEVQMMEDWILHNCTDQKTKDVAASVPQDLASSWLRILREAWENLLASVNSPVGKHAAPPAEVWPFLDAFRLLAVGLFPVSTEVDALAHSVLLFAVSPPGLRSDKNILTALRLACNALSFARFRGNLFFPAASACSNREPVTTLVIHGLLSNSVGVRETASYVCWNLALSWADRDAVVTDADEESWVVEILSAIVECLKKTVEGEREVQIATRLLATLALLLYFCPLESPIDDLLEAFEVHPTVDRLMKSCAAEAKADPEDHGGHLIALLCTDVEVLIRKRASVKNPVQ